MALYAKVVSHEIAVHRLSAALGEWAVGNVTRDQVIAALGLSGDDLTEIDAIAAKYNGFANTTAGNIQRAAYLWQIERAFILAETGDYTEAKCKSVLGF